jgi:ring-1,2-phenylacetyl-CoA epoxidase subunit PaaC
VTTPPSASSPPLRSSAAQLGGNPDRRVAGRVDHRLHLDYVLALADDALISAQRTAWWISRAPQLEEDVALANIALDQLGQARALLAHAGRLEDAGRGEDELAYLRDERDYRNVKLVERPQTDFGVAIARLLLVATWQSELYAALVASSDAALAGVAGKAVKEVAYHLDHARQWTLRLGDGTPESHERMQAAIDAEWPYLEELFEPVDAGLVEAGVAADPTRLRAAVLIGVEQVLAEATLTVPTGPADVGGGRRGLHTEHLGYLLAEMQHLHRSHPEATW